MHDQAERLRRKLQSDLQHHAKVLAIMSGKGGVGKSNFSLNLGLSLSQLGSKVLIIDLDIGMANLDILMGLTSDYTIADLIEKSLPIEKVIQRGPGNLHFIAGGNGLNHLVEITGTQFDHFCDQLSLLQTEYEYILFDMGAGATKESLQFIASADEGLLIVTPEPTAITDGYAMLKHVHHTRPSLAISVVVNRIDSVQEGEVVGSRMEMAAERFLNKTIHVLGTIPEDRSVFQSVKDQKPYVIRFPDGKASRSVKMIAKRVLNGNSQQEVPDRIKNNFISRFKKYFHRRQVM